MTTVSCPRDGAALQKTTNNGIEIEYCERCGGVWLDHGELEKLIELAAATQSPKFGPPNVGSAPTNQYSGHHGYNKDQYKHKKKESWLGDIFDF